MIVVIEKSPGEIGKLFEVINDLIKEKLSTVVPLRLRLESTYKAYQKELINQIDKTEIIVILDNLEDPVGFVRKKLLAKERFERELEDLTKERDSLVYECDVSIVEEVRDIKERIKLLPDKLLILLDRYSYLDIIMAPDGFITQVFDVLENSDSRRIRLRKSDRWKKIMNAKFRFSTLVYKLQQAWNDAWETTDELEFKKHISQFDLFLARLDKFKDIETEIEKSPIELSITTEQLQDLYNKINQWTGEFIEIVTVISTNVGLKRLVREERKRLVTLTNEQKRLKLKIKDINGPIDTVQTVLKNKTYILDAFWNYIELEYDEFSNTVTRLLDFDNYNNWLDARNKYEIYLKAKFILDSHETMFNSLVNAYNQAMANLRQAKRNFSRYNDRPTRLTLEKCTLQPVKISVDENDDITNLILLCTKLDKVEEYIDDTNLFYDDNAKLVMSMYRDNQLIMNMWVNIFARLMGKET